MTRGLSRPASSGLHEVLEKGTLAGLSETQLLHRYLAGGDERAFEALVARHGPMVHGVCRRLLRDPGDVEDAFQATFLILVRKAALIREPGRLSPWLHGVAYRVARRARAGAWRRKAREIEAKDFEPGGPGDDVGRAELRTVLDEELSRLPERYRAPIVLCYLEGRTHDEAASQLAWPVGTVRSRLARARDRLRTRLVRRGITPSVAVLGPEFGLPWARVEVTEAQIHALLRAATRTSAGRIITTATTSGSVASLVDGVLNAMLLSKLSVSAVVVLATILIGTGSTLLARQDPAPGTSGGSQSRPPEAPATVPEPPQDSSSSPSTSAATDSSTTTDRPSRLPSPRELQVRLRKAQRKAESCRKLQRAHMISQETSDAANADVEIFQAQIAEEIETLEENLELLELQRTAQADVVKETRRRIAYLEKLFAQYSRLVLSRAVSAVTADAAEYKLETERSRLNPQIVELKTIELRIKHVQRRLHSLKPSTSPRPDVPTEPDKASAKEAAKKPGR